MTDLLELTEELCAVGSVSREETELAGLVERRLLQTARHLRIERVGDNVVARTELGRDRRIVLGGHLDTVPPNGNAAPHRDGDTLHGLGTADMKGGLAVLLALASGMAADPAAARFDATFVFYAGEEIAEEWNGLRELFAQAPELVTGDLAVLLEPTDGWVEAGCQGTVHLAATFRGARAHTARPWMGANAIHQASAALRGWRRRIRAPSTSTACPTASLSRSCASKVASPTTSCRTSAVSWSTAGSPRA